MHTIEVSFPVWQALTARLESERDTYTALIGRLLGLREEPRAVAESGQGDWIVKGTSFPAGTEFRGRSKGRMYSARVEEGALVMNGQRYDSPSHAAAAIAGYNINGWKFWECRVPGGEWRPILSLRKGS